MKIYNRNLSKPNQSNAFNLLELLVVIAILAFLAVMFIPSGIEHPSRKTGLRIKCMNNLKQIGLAFRIWEGDHGDLFPMQVYTNKLGEPLYLNSSVQFRYFQVMSNELPVDPQFLLCPADSKRTAATNFTTDFNSTRISYFVGLDANDPLPQSFLAGDANITSSGSLHNGLWVITTNQTIGWTDNWHEGMGNVALADGSVQQFSTHGLQSALEHTGLTTNRFLLPEDVSPK